MSNDFDPPVGVSAAALGAGDIPEIRISAADRPPEGRRREEPRAGSASVGARTRFLPQASRLGLPRAGRLGATIGACSLAGLAGWGLYGVVAPHYPEWSDVIAAKFAQMSAAPVDLLPVTQKMEAEIEALQKKVQALEKSRSATAKSLASLEGLNRRIDEAKSDTKAEIDALSSRVLLFQQETTAKLAELSAAHPAKRRDAEPIDSKAAPAAEKSKPAPAAEKARQRQTVRHDAFDPAQHPSAPGAPRPLGAPADRL
jgi:hypothetical protein